MSTDQSLHIKHITVLFTDISGSTELYHKYGDIRAYKVVRDHFKILFKAVESHGGVVVKTIGDAVMATFINSHDTLSAALMAMEQFPFTDASRELLINVKLGIHSGSCIAVNLNNRIDYFGTTINVASRIQELSENGELTISDEIINRPESKRIISGYVNKVIKKSVQIKGIDNPIKIYKIKLPEKTL